MSGLRSSSAARVALSVVLTLGAAHALAQTPSATTPTANSDSVPPIRWALRVPAGEKVVFRGLVNRDTAGLGAGTMMYPAPGLAGFVAAVVTHGVLNAGMRESQRSQMQSSADLVLQPFTPVLAGMSHQLLLEAAARRIAAGSLTRLISSTEAAGGDWLIEVAPVYSMTQDRRAILLDNAVRIVPPGTAPVVYTQTVRVISEPLLPPPSVPLPAPPVAAASVAVAASGSANEPASPTPVVDDPLVSAWLAQRGRRLGDESAALLAESLDVAMKEFVAPPVQDKSAHKTFRYAEGGSEKMERGQLIEERCGRTLLRTLRGWLMSIPTVAAGERCAVSAEPVAAVPATATQP